MHGLAVFERMTSFCMGLIHRKLCRFLLMFWTGFTSLSVLLLFLYHSPSFSLCTVFNSISSNIDEVLSINPSANKFVFGAFNVRHKDWIVYSGGTDRPVNSNNLSQIFNFSSWIPGCHSRSRPLLDLFLSSDASISSARAFAQFENSDHVVLLVSIDFAINSKQDAPFHRVGYDFSHADWMILMIIWEISMGEHL